MFHLPRNLTVTVLALALLPCAVQAREERLIGQVVCTLAYEEEIPEGLLQVYDFGGDFSRLGHARGVGFQLLGKQGEILWGIAINLRADGESYIYYAADRNPDGSLSGWFSLDGHTAYPEYFGYGELAGMTEPRFTFRLEGILTLPD